MKHFRLALGLSFAALILLTACAAPRNTKLLAFFFDGVPAEKAAEPAVLAPIAETTTRIPDLILAARAAPPGVRHRPYAERECLSCHESEFSQKLRLEPTALCQSCHAGYEKPRAFSHAPVAAGRCLTCHSPHESLHPGLLNKPSRQICAECHADERLLQTPAHQKNAEASCLTCHDPHGGTEPHFLRPQRPPQLAASATPGLSP